MFLAETRYFHSASVSSQVYKKVLANLMFGGSPAIDWRPIQGGEEILLVASC